MVTAFFFYLIVDIEPYGFKNLFGIRSHSAGLDA